MRDLLHKSFTDTKKSLEFVIKNIDFLKGSLNQYGFSTETIINNLDDVTLTTLIEKDKIGDLYLKDFVKIYKQNEKAFLKFFNFIEKRNDNYDTTQIVEIILERQSNDSIIITTFQTITAFEDFIKNTIDNDFTIRGINDFTLWNHFFGGNYYLFYKDYIVKYGVNTDLEILLKAYEESPIEDTELKDLVENKLKTHFSGDDEGSLVKKDGLDYVLVFDLCTLTKFFDENGEDDGPNVLCYGEAFIDPYIDFNDITNYLYNEDISNSIREFMMTYLRNQEITLNMDLVDDFDVWVEEFDDYKSIFTFKLYDERIYGMDNHKLEIIVMYSKELGQLRDILKKSYKKTYIKLLTQKLREQYYDHIEEIFGGDIQKVNRELWVGDTRDGEYVSKDVYLIRYTNLLNDALAWADYYPFDRDLPTNIIRLIRNLQNEHLGRHDGEVRINSYDIVDDFIPNMEQMGEEISEDIYTLTKEGKFDLDYTETEGKKR